MFINFFFHLNFSFVFYKLIIFIREKFEGDDEQILKAYTKDIEDNAIRKTERKTERKTAIKLIRKGKMSLEEIAECVPSLSMEELKELEAEVLQLA